MELKPWLKFYPKGVPEKLNYPDKPLFDLLRKTAEKYPQHPAIVFKGNRITCVELDRLSDKFATALYDMGVEKGNCVAIYLPNIPQFIISYYGALKTGAFVTTINPMAKQKEVEFQLGDSEAKIVVCLDIFYPIVKAARGNINIEQIIVTSEEEFAPMNKTIPESKFKKSTKLETVKEPIIHFFKDLMTQYSAQPPVLDINPKEDLAVLLYSGGTTGAPKGAMLTHLNLVSNALMCAKWFQGNEKEDIMLTVLPLYHIYGMTTSMNFPIYLADTLILLPRPNLIEIMKTIEEFGVTLLCAVPTLYAKLITHPDINKYNLKSLRFCFSGAAQLSSEVQKKFMEYIGGILVEGYGLTEASPVTHCNPLDLTMANVKVGSIGLPWPDTEAKIVDLETGEKEMAPGQRGELVVRGPQVMKGYWKHTEKTKEAIRNGWLHTGDIGKMDEDGYFYMIDRKKDLIKFKGYSIYPRELEDIINEHPAVKLSGVIGKPIPVVGEIPKAFIVLREKMDVTEEEIISFVRERIAINKAIQEVEFRRELPVNSIGKVMRKKLWEEEFKKMQT